MGLTTYKATWIHVLFCLIWPALTQTINDLINEVKSSSAYSDIRSSICAQCALAGSNHTGCWGQGNLGSGAGQSPCPSGNATCFCDTANQEEVVNLIRDESYRLHQEGCPDRPETAFALAFSGYREFCAQHNQEVPATLSRTSDSTGTASSPSSNSSKASDPNPPGGGLGKGEIAGIAVGSAFGIGILILVIALFKRRRDRNPGSGPVSSRWLGLTRLTANERRDDQFSFNVVFIHGLQGHPEDTWSKAPAAVMTEQAMASPPPAKVFWPQEYLVPDVPQASVWTYGYNANIIGLLYQANNKNTISQHGKNLSIKLRRDIDNTKPIVFIVHSLGGIILKDAIGRSEAILNRTKLIIFLGTPHRGSGLAAWGQIASNLARLALHDSNRRMLDTLKVNSEVLDNIHQRFTNDVSTKGIQIHSFQEAKGMSGMRGFHNKVVDDFSSKLDLPSTLETVETIEADHREMARYSSREEEGYRAILGVLRDFVRRGLGRQEVAVTGTADQS